MSGMSGVADAIPIAVKEIPSWVSLCSALAPITAIGVTMAPIPTMLKVASDRSVGNLPLLPYSSMVVNAFVWVVYGLLKEEKKVYLTNAVGFVLGSLYSLEFRKNCPKNASSLPGTLHNHLQASILIFVFTSLCVTMLPRSMATRVVGLEGVTFCVLLFASPLAALRVVVESKSAKSIPLPFTLACILNCFCWSAVGIFEMHDSMIYCPNLLGLMFGVAQFALFMIYGSGSASQASTPAQRSQKGGAFVLPI